MWPALYTSSGTAPSQATGWEAAAYSSVTFDIAENWNGRIWGRRDCDFSSGSTLPSTCITGGCLGGLECTQPGVPPATLAEFNLAGGGVDWYDLSAVDGSNLPMEIYNSAGCDSPKCTNDINSSCPSNLSVYDSNGYVVGCYSSCSSPSQTDASDSPDCCSGSYDTPATCPSSGVADYSVCHDACPSYYCYAYDDTTALQTCTSSLESSYTVTFCPPS